MAQCHTPPPALPCTAWGAVEPHHTHLALPCKAWGAAQSSPHPAMPSPTCGTMHNLGCEAAPPNTHCNVLNSPRLNTAPPINALHNSGCNPQPGVAQAAEPRGASAAPGWAAVPAGSAGLCPLPSTPLPCAAPRRSPGSPAMCTPVSLRVKPAASRIQWLERMAPLHIWFNARAWRLA